MNSTIEVVWIVNTVLYFCSGWLASALDMTTFTIKRFVFISMMASLLLLIFYWADGLFLGIEFLFVLIHAKKKWSLVFEFELCRLFFVTVGWKIAGGKIVNAVLFVPSYSKRWIFMMFSVILLTLILVCVIRLAKKRKLFLKVKITLGEKEHQVTGFLDSGNLLEHNQIPVIFLAMKYHSSVRLLSYQWVTYTTIGSKEITKIYPALIEINQQWKKVYVALSSKLNDSMECLLNKKLFD